MATGPKIAKIDPFSQTLRGTFGRFKTANSYPVYYLQTCISVDALDDLSTASALVTTEAVNFDELIQRDIDHSRVMKIANEYLVGSSKKVVFFPPLLACIVLTEDNGSIQRRYSDYIEEISSPQAGGSRELTTTWDGNGFELTLALANKSEGDNKILLKTGKEERFYLESQIRLNPKRAKLIVLDGQHRLEALRLVKKGPNKATLQDVEVPVCLVFTPHAVAGSVEDMVEDFRELFVRVNEEAKRVSGHFLILLQDDSYTALTIRALAAAWRANISQGYPLLHMLEWNQRVEEQTRKRTRPFSITTIGILHDTLLDQVYDSELAETILRLDEVAGEFEKIDPEFNYSDLADKTNGAAIDAIIAKQINKHVVPALSVLLLEAPPYRRLQDQTRDAFRRLHAEVANHNATFATLGEYFDKFKYAEDELGENAVKVALKEFIGWIAIPEKDQIYFLHAFQQGMLRAWIKLCAVLAPLGMNPTPIARATVAALSALAMAPDKEYLAPSRQYTQRVLWKTERVNFGAGWTREAWTEILVASLLKPSVVNAAIKALAVEKRDVQKVGESLKSIAYQHAIGYCGRLRVELKKDTKSHISDHVSADKLLLLRAQEAGDAKARKQFEAAIDGIVDTRFSQATQELTNILEISAAALSQPEL